MLSRMGTAPNRELSFAPGPDQNRIGVPAMNDVTRVSLTPYGLPAECAEAECDRATWGRGLCEMHYVRAMRAGTLPPRMSAEDKFWARVQKSDDGCWLWMGKPASNGYGRVRIGGKSYAAHRVAYEFSVGPIPDDLEIDHVMDRGCTSRACVNPAHLEPVTHQVNMMRAGNARRAAIRSLQEGDK